MLGKPVADRSAQSVIVRGRLKSNCVLILLLNLRIKKTQSEDVDRE
jgi:hypothetical protein